MGMSVRGRTGTGTDLGRSHSGKTGSVTAPELGGASDPGLDVPAALRAACTPLPQAIDDEAVLGRWRFLDGKLAKLAEKKPDRSRT